MTTPAFKFQIHPSWFGGPEQADKAIVELAEHQAFHESMKGFRHVDVANIWVYRAPGDTWYGTVEFTA